MLGLKVYIYYNLHKKVFSIKAMEGANKGRVVGYSHYITLSEATPKVSEAGRLRVLREGVKNVHAGIIGTLISVDKGTIKGLQVEYNPYLYTTFVYCHNLAPCGGGAFYLENKKVFKI
jgi:diketogulonate reductase-like aldo/keto reductase